MLWSEQAAPRSVSACSQNLVSSRTLRGSHLALVDRDSESIQQVRLLAERLNKEWDAGLTITSHTHHAEAIGGASFVINSIEVPPRERLWRSDFEIPLRFGVRQPTAENGGPAAFAHAARNLGPIMEIAHDMERLSPDAWFINFTNPLTWITDAVARHSKIRAVGLCHQQHVGYQIAGQILADHLGFEDMEKFTNTEEIPSSQGPRLAMRRRAKPRLQIKGAGINHFTWMLAIRDTRQGEDLYPRFAEAWAAYDPEFEPLTRKMYEIFGIFPNVGDGHLAEYLPWVSDPRTEPWESLRLSLHDWDYWERDRAIGKTAVQRMAAGEEGIEELRDQDSEGALEIIESIASANPYYNRAVNIPNHGYITNLPEGAVVEVPAMSTGAGIDGIHVGALPEAVAELCRRQLAVIKLGVDAVINGDRQGALQCLLLSPGVTDFSVAEQILDAYLVAYREHLPTFWS